MTPPTNKPRSRYPGLVSSGLAAARRTIRRAGLPLGKIIGRYEPFGRRQEIVPGVNFWRIGVSNKIGVRVLGGERMSAQERSAKIQQAVAALRAAGLPFDDDGVLHCDGGVA